MNKDLDNYSIGNLKNTTQLHDLIEGYKNINLKCDAGKSDADNSVGNATKVTVAKPLKDLSYIIIDCLSAKPELVDESIRKDIGLYFKSSGLKAIGLVSNDNLTLLGQSSHPSQTWLKFEFLLIHLIKEQVYDSKILANEVLTTVKHELSPEIASRFSSVISSCVKHCRSSDANCNDVEEEEKWCEIIDWMSWFISSDESNSLE